VDERVTLAEYSAGVTNSRKVAEESNSSIVKGITGESLQIIQTPQLDQLKPQLETLYQKGFRSVAICLLHSYAFPNHETIVANLVRSIGFTNVTLSSDIMPKIRVVPRGMTTVLDAYLTPKIKQYIDSFSKGFQSLEGVQVEFMRSDGGLATMDEFRGFSAIMSGTWIRGLLLG
jgi:5-oxoprolinase (ATP-hydrolysing)